ncbi:hypothetical protein GCM10010988_11620 [Cnuibacter physcomitrellae]|uniref:Uncharacterized protein n=1 Tax=Cnuibacter physcomitrellae TaxID=1619308 RepID=A0A1X9LLK4_9MICO|nr:hypothetical protein [Cnuibacter physcomitrellae]ARJ05997.1 hypothetical protein B5808_12755 [Cnuibacter physcomitrellae]MCS5496252.1 hypothetical protein [Cnuibacter physcomitrellae]GGI36972.1 hypothetical protein GCM10010988_11620 [Cnuibacter physcomitrellae]
MSESGSAEQQLAELRRELTALRSQLARANAETEELRQRLKGSRGEAARFAAQTQSMRRSLSWRITRPLRMWRRKGLNGGWT